MKSFFSELSIGVKTVALLPSDWETSISLLIYNTVVSLLSFIVYINSKLALTGMLK